MKKNPFTILWKHFSYFLLIFLLILDCNLPNESNSFNRETKKEFSFNIYSYLRRIRLIPVSLLCKQLKLV